MQDHKPINFEESIMKEISAGKVKMKPRWVFILSSMIAVFGLAALSSVLVFLSDIITFSLRSHGPMGDIRYAELISSFPWWALFFLIFMSIIGVLILRKYDFSYKKNFAYIIVLGIVVVVALGVIANFSGADRTWRDRPMMRGLYHQVDDGRGVGRGHFIAN